VRCSLRCWLHIVGSLLGLIGVIFVGQRLYCYADQIKFSDFNFIVYSILALLTVSYGTANLLLARAWWHLLLFLDVKTDWMWAVKIYGLSQLAKYVPGNIFHLAGRQALGMSAGLAALTLAKSAFWELGLITVSGALFSVLVLSILWHGLSILISLILFTAISMVFFVALRHLFSPSVSAALILQMVFLSISSAVFIGTLEIVLPSSASLPTLPALSGVYVIAWLAGLITPGAPAGVGVREMVLMFLLGDHIAEAELLLAVLLSRGITVLGDLCYFMVSVLLKKS
jgi:hypothetical protein